MPRIKVYLDNCTYNRPFDDQSQIMIALETEAKRHIQRLIVEEKIDKEPFDYTEWSRSHYADVDLHDFNQRAVEYDKNNPIS